MIKNSDRINGFDALRTIAMWLGILLHSIIAYKSTAENSWPQDPKVRIVFLDWLYDYIHIFRMPLFFMVAGFFSRMVIVRSGIRYFITQRFKRIVVPFIIGVIIVVPITLLPFFFYMLHYVQNIDIHTAWQKSFQQMFRWNGFAHLWFLYYLIIFSSLSIAAKYILDIAKIKMPSKWHGFFENISLLKISVVVILLFFILFGFQVYVPFVYTGVWPKSLFILYYGFFYSGGWLMQINMKSIRSLSANCWTLFIVGTLLSFLFYFTHYWDLKVLAYLLVSIQTISLIAGITGLFMKYCHAESRLWRYCSDAAYWIYIVHMCLVGSMQVLLLYSPMPGWSRLPLVLLTTFSFSLFSYHYFVRFTIIGEYLHGKRNKWPIAIDSNI